MDAPRTAAVIFDLDGTLVDSEPNYFEAARRLLADRGIRDFTWRDHAPFIGIGTHETLTVLRERYELDMSVDDLLAETNRLYLELAATRTETFPHMRTLVRELRAAGLPLAVASGSSREAIEAVLASTGLTEEFSTVVSAEEVAHGKPEPDVFLEAARRLEAPAHRCVVLEDAPPGAEAAHRAGMRCLAVPHDPTVAGHPSFATAGLVFSAGHAGFALDRALAWIGPSASARET